MPQHLLDPATGADIELPAEGSSEPGHLLCRGPNVMLGYLNRPDETASSVDADGFLRTGDIATVSADGVVTIVDRLKELIKYKGYQIAPASGGAAPHPPRHRRSGPAYSEASVLAM